MKAAITTLLLFLFISTVSAYDNELLKPNETVTTDNIANLTVSVISREIGEESTKGEVYADYFMMILYCILAYATFRFLTNWRSKRN